jgi:phenylacetate-CoA ligase
VPQGKLHNAVKMNELTTAERILKSIAWPLVDFKNRSSRLREYRRLRNAQWLSGEQRAAMRLESLREAVAHAFTTVPYYRARWGDAPAISAESDIRRLPVLAKSDIQAHGPSLVSTLSDSDQLVEARTGGSTGVALRVLFDRACQDHRNAAALRSNEWAGWQPAQAAGALWGNPPVARTLRERLRAEVSERLVYLDTVALTPQSVAIFMQELRKRNITVLFGHAHSLFVVARICEREELQSPQFTAIVSTSMMLLKSEREFIESFFGCPVTDRYGCEEVGLIESECEWHEGLHVNDDHLIVEVLREDGTPVDEGEVGQIVVTDLLNRGMPLIRYSVGDMSSWAPGECRCGRKMRRLARVLGRTADFLKTADGRLVAGVSLVERTLTAIEGLEQLQLVQRSLGSVTARCVLAPDANEARISAELVRALREAMDPRLDVAIEVGETLSQDRNGKYRFTVCEC